MARALVILVLSLAACGGAGASPDAAPRDAAVDCDGGCAAEGEVCGTSPADLDGGGRPCASGLVCCYPCGIPDCLDRCAVPCSGAGCQPGGCPGPFP